ncbi:MAG: pyridine nucleotide-disulfide oxidoreductase [Acidimicrobiia bacterium]|nr:pyridine nucleotide-disulfide oxidoreductase [Acidimicrobiia bacterium]
MAPSRTRTSDRPVVVIAGLGDTGVMVATRLTRSCRVVAVTTRPALVSGQELGTRLVDPDRWKRNYCLPLRRFRRLDEVEVHHGRITDVDLDASQVHVTAADGSTTDIDYDALVIATGVTNGFWRDDRVESLDAAESRIAASARRLSEAHTIAVIGGGATGVSVADNLARAGHDDVHLFLAGEEPLPSHHPSVRRWMDRTLQADGVTVHRSHRALLPGGSAPDSITDGPVEWSTGQPPFAADAVVWTVGAVRPHTGFLPTGILDADGFVVVDSHLQVPDHPRVFAVGDVAASDPLRSSARNWGHRVIVANVEDAVKGRPLRRTFSAPEHRWGSILGLQPEGLTVAQANGKRFRVPRRLAEPMLYGVFVTRGLYGGLRRAD